MSTIHAVKIECHPNCFVHLERLGQVLLAVAQIEMASMKIPDRCRS